MPARKPKIERIGNMILLKRDQWKDHTATISDYPGLLDEVMKYTWTYYESDHPYLKCGKLNTSLHKFVLAFLYGADQLNHKFKLDNEIKKLSTFSIYIDEGTPESLSFVGKLRNAKGKVSGVDSIISAIDQVLVDYSSLMKLHLDEIDLEVLRQQYNALSQMKKKYEAQKREIERENERIETVAKVIDETVRRHSKSITDRQKKSTAFLERTTSLKDSLKEIIGQSKSIQRYRPTIENTQVNFLSNTVQDYSFVSRLTVKEINAQFFMQHVNSSRSFSESEAFFTGLFG